MNRLRSFIPILGRFFSHTLGVRFLFALAISVVLWVIFTGEQNPVREDFFDADIPIETTRLGDGLVVSRITPSTVRMQIAAPRDIWDSLSADNFRAVVDLFSVGVGLHEIRLDAERSDTRIRIISVEPDTATVALEERKEKEVPVRVALAGNQPQGYQFLQPESLPDIVKVIGPASKVELVDAAWIDVDVGNASSTVNLTQRAIPRDAQGVDVSGVQLDPAVVQVTVPVEQVTSYKDVPIRVRIEGQPASGYWIARYRAEPATATLVGPPDDLNAMNFVFTEAISVEGATQSITTEVELERPPRVGISASDQVTVTVDVSPIIASAETQVAVTLVNLQPGLEAIVSPTTVSVTLSGPAPALRSLQPNSVIVSLNLSGVGAGTYALVPDHSTPPQITVESITPALLEVIVRSSPTLLPTQVPDATPSPTDGASSGSPTPSP
jgi:YbbR domain-containing protein